MTAKFWIIFVNFSAEIYFSCVSGLGIFTKKTLNIFQPILKLRKVPIYTAFFGGLSSHELEFRLIGQCLLSPNLCVIRWSEVSVALFRAYRKQGHTAISWPCVSDQRRKSSGGGLCWCFLCDRELSWSTVIRTTTHLSLSSWSSSYKVLVF